MAGKAVKYGQVREVAADLPQEKSRGFCRGVGENGGIWKTFPLSLSVLEAALSGWGENGALIIDKKIIRGRKLAIIYIQVVFDVFSLRGIKKTCLSKNENEL
jgi:hypothetical protein